MMMRNRTIGIILLLLTTISVSAQKAERDYIRKGNRAYKDSTYVNAEVNYRKAIDVNPKSAISMYNLGNTLMQQNKLQEAMEQFVAATKMEKDKGNLAQIYHNMGVIFHSGKDYAKAALRERNRIAREIHDNVGHVLSRTILLTGAARAINKDQNLDSLLKGLDNSLNSAMDSIRSSVHDLHDDAVNLQETIKGIITDIKMENVGFEYDMSEIIPREIKYCFISIVKEAISNAMKYSSATQINVILTCGPPSPKKFWWCSCSLVPAQAAPAAASR